MIIFNNTLDDFDFDFSHNFERTEDRKILFLKWTDFRLDIKIYMYMHIFIKWGLFGGIQ